MKKLKLFTLLCLFCIGMAKAETEPANNTSAGADAISQNGSQSGTTVNGDNDWYALTTTGDGNITVSCTTAANAYISIYLYDNDATTQLGFTGNSAGSGISFTATGLAAGNYYILVLGNTPDSYTVSNTVALQTIPNDPEANNTLATAIDILPNNSANGHIAYRSNGGSFDASDYYKLVTTDDGSISVSLTNDNNNYEYLYLYDNDGITILGFTSDYAQGGINFTVNGLGAGTYYILVHTTNSSFYSGYTLSNTVTPAAFTNDAEPDNSFATATTLNLDPDKSGHICYRTNGGGFDGDDYRKVIMYTPGSLNIDLTMAIPGNNSFAYFYDSTQTLLNFQTGTNASYNIHFANLPAGQYYLRVRGNSSADYNSYSITSFQVPCNTAASSITAGGATTFCAGGSVTLSTNETYSSYLWSNGATTNSTVASSSGSYTLTGTDIDGCATHHSNSISVTADPLPTPSITANGAITFCAGGSVTLDAGSYSSWSWSNSSTSQTINVNANGTFSATVTDAYGCSGTSAPVTVTVNPLPNVTLGAFADICDSTTAYVLTGGLPIGGTYSGTAVSSGNFNATTAGDGSHVITYAYTDGNTCSNSATAAINVIVCGCNVTTATAGSDQAICGTTTNLTGNTPSIGTGLWSIFSGTGGSIFDAGDPATSFTGTPGTSYVLHWTITNGSCTSTDDVLIIVPNAVYKPNTISGQDTLVCGTTQTYTANPLKPGIYNWSGFPAGTIINSQNSNTINVTFPSGSFTSFLLSVTHQIGCTLSPPKTLRIRSLFVKPSITGLSIVDPHQHNVVFSLPLYNGVTYNWVIPAGVTLVSGQGTNSVTVNWGGLTKTIRCTISNGCSSIHPSKQITVAGTRLEDYTGEESIVSDINLYPNPAVDAATVEFNSATNASGIIRLMNAAGKIVQSKSFIMNEGTNMIDLDLNKLSKALYLVEIQSGEIKFEKSLVIQ